MEVNPAKPLHKMNKEELLQLLYAQELELAEFREAAARAENQSLYAREFWEAARTEAYRCVENAWAVQRQAEAGARQLLEAAQYQANVLLWNIQQAQAAVYKAPSAPIGPAERQNEWWYESIERFGEDA